jgi:hypothetical protein
VKYDAFAIRSPDNEHSSKKFDPVKELKGFHRIHLKSGDSQVVTFKITADLLRFYDYHLNHVIEPGDFDIMIGPNSRDVKKKTITVL